MDTAEAEIVFRHYYALQNAIVANNGPVLGYDTESIPKYRTYFEKESHTKADGCYAWGANENIDVGKNYGKLTFLLRQLEKQSPYAIGGEGTKIRMSKYQIMVKEDEDDDEFESICPLSDMNLKGILHFCTPSPFGDLVAQETRIDPSVRLAMECPAERLQIKDEDEDNEDFPDFLFSLRNSIRQTLLQNAYPFIDLVLTKMNIYSEDGHFQ
eukprot:gene2493-3244_t